MIIPAMRNSPVSLSIATGGTSGTYYGYCGIIAQVFNQELGDTMNPLFPPVIHGKYPVMQVGAKPDRDRTE